LGPDPGRHTNGDTTNIGGSELRGDHSD
jgi:hypothetical protein